MIQYAYYLHVVTTCISLQNKARFFLDVTIKPVGLTHIKYIYVDFFLYLGIYLSKLAFYDSYI
jgi:hypothetical protein